MSNGNPGRPPIHHKPFAPQFSEPSGKPQISAAFRALKPRNPGSWVLDSYFTIGSDNFNQIENNLGAYGIERLRNEIIMVVSTIRATFENGEFLSIRNCVQESPKNTARTAFFALFNAYYDLMIRSGRYPDDFMKIRSALKNSQRALTMQAHYTTTDDRKKNIKKMTGLIDEYFVKKDVPVIGSGHALIIDLENSLRRSRYEASRYEFKIGCCTLSDAPKLNEQIYEKLARTAAAIANTSPNADGYIYLGVADSEADALRVVAIRGGEYYKLGDVFFVGLKHDLECLKVSIENYVKKLLKEFEKTGLGNPLKTQLIACVEHADYKGLPFVRMRIPTQKDLTSFVSDFPIRKNSDTVNMTTAEAVAQAKLFAR